MKNKPFFTFLLSLILAAYTQAYTPEYDNNGQLTLLTADLSRNGDSAADLVYGIFLVGNNLVDQNTAFNNGFFGGAATNMNSPADCTFGVNHAP